MTVYKYTKLLYIEIQYTVLVGEGCSPAEYAHTPQQETLATTPLHSNHSVFKTNT